jgi:hypothetical protein
MTEAQARALCAGDYVAYLGAWKPQGYKVTHVAEPAGDTTAPRQIVVSQLYGDDWVLASAFRRVEGPLLSREEVAAFRTEQTTLRDAIDAENALRDAQRERMECAA